MKKKLLALILAIAMVLPLCPAGVISLPVAAATTSGKTGDCTWTLDGTVLTISGNGKMGDYSYVYSNDTYTYYNTAPWGSSITSLTIEEGVTSIGKYAFSYCTSLTSITIPDSVISIGNGAFSYSTSITSISLPDIITSIGYATFRGCRSLTSVVIPDGVTAIGDEVFSGCSSLTAVVIPKGVTAIGNEAFKGCRSLTSIVIPDNVTTIGYCAFCCCESLALVDLGNSVTSIGFHSFYYCLRLTSIVIPNSVTTIGEDAFLKCNLTEVTIPDSVTSIGSRAFGWCFNLDDVWYVGTRSSIANISIGFKNECLTSATWHYLDSDCDESCNACEKAYPYAHLFDNACDTDCSGCGLVRETNHTFGGDCGAECKECGLTRTPLSEHNYDNIADDTCNVCKFVRELPYDSYGITADCCWYRVGTKLTITGNGAMANYSPFSPAPWGTDITEVVIENGVTTIGEDAFSYSEGLTSLALSRTVTTISIYAFDACTALSDIWYEGTSAQKEAILIANNNSALTSATWHYDSCLANAPTYTHSYDEANDPDCNECGYVRSVPDDIDGDGEISDWDGIVLARYLAGWDVEIPNPEALDLDSDGEITDWDGVLLDRFLAGWDIKIG